MKKTALLILTGFFLVAICVSIYAQNKECLPDALSVIHSRKSVRHFTGEGVSQDELLTLVKAGMAAPTAVNMQPWSFVIVTERAKLDALSKALPYARMLDKAAAAIIVCAIPEKAFQGKLEIAIIDSSCAGENILLAAEALGLGAVWTGVYPDAGRMDAVRGLFGIPASIVPLNVIPVGHPTSEDKPKNKFKQENVHWEKW